MSKFPTHNVHGEGDAMHEGQFDGEPEIPQRIWLLRNEDGTFDDCWQMSTIEDSGDIPYVPASALAEVWEKAIAIMCPYCAEGDKSVWDDFVKYHYHYDGTAGCTASKLIEARDAALSVQKENKDAG